MIINPTRPMEQLVGSNYGIVRQRLANVHCMTRIREQLRLVRPKRMRDYPVQLRRGWALCALEAIAQYRSTYIGVSFGAFDYKAPLTWREGK